MTCKQCGQQDKRLDGLSDVWRSFAQESRDSAEKHTVLRETNLAYASALELCAKQLEERMKL